MGEPPSSFLEYSVLAPYLKILSDKNLTHSAKFTISTIEKLAEDIRLRGGTIDDFILALRSRNLINRGDDV